ncbi:poly [ADP-ribose] polymerase tankyrase-1-like isoform X1 [Ptychodera flava]|uniref:poly [ADP-ribose] polymerase tankyrase-1-like isoform X1 n=1 Tax=Ptychodera flava TaxID=63121 RepID=UPI00396A63FB
MEKRQKQIVTPELFECAANGNANRLFCVLEEGDNVNPLTGAGDWPLMVAVENGHLDIIQLLYERGGDVSRRHPSTNATVLHVASARGHIQVVIFLLNICRRDGLLGPGKGDNISFYQELDINAMNNSGQTALQMAAAKGFSKVVRALLMRGASSALLDSDGNVYKCQEYEGVQGLLETHRKERAMRIMAMIRDRKGLSKLKRVWQSNFDHNLRNFKGDTPLMVACYHGRVDAVKFLVQSAIHRQVVDSNTDSYWNHEQSDTDSGSYMDHNTSTMMNSRFLGTRTDPSSASELSDTESNYMYNARRCKTPSGGWLQQSAEFTSSGRFNRYSVLSQNPKKISPVSSEDDLAVAAAVARQQKAQDLNRSFNRREQAFRDVVGSETGLSKADIYLISFSEHNNPPYYNTSAALKRVINHLCDYNFRDGSTCLHRAVECSSENRAIEIIQSVLEKERSCVNMQDYAGLTPLHLACSQGKKHMVKMLTDLEFIDLNVRTLDGKLPEELTLNKSIQKMVCSARELHPYKPLPSLPTPPASSVGDGSIDLDMLNDRFQQLLRSQDS